MHILYVYMCLWMCQCVCVSVSVCVWHICDYPWRPEEDVRFLGATCHGWWEMDSGSMEEEQVLLTAVPSSHTPKCLINLFFITCRSDCSGPLWTVKISYFGEFVCYFKMTDLMASNYFWYCLNFLLFWVQFFIYSWYWSSMPSLTFFCIVVCSGCCNKFPKSW